MSCPLTLRLLKGSKLTFAELDNNFIALRDCIDTIDSLDTFVTGGTYNASTVTLDFSGTTGFDPFSVDVSALLDDTNNYVSGGTMSGTTLTLERTGGLSDVLVDLSSLTFTGNTSGDCITELWVDNLYGCSPITVHDNIQHISSSATGINSIAWGSGTTASGDFSHAEGVDTVANGIGSHVEGGGTGGIGPQANGDYSHAEGFRSGVYSNAIGKGSHSEGWSTYAGPGDGAHAEGFYTIANGNYSHAEGHGTTAGGIASHAEGYLTKANGHYSHTENFINTADADYSHTEGRGTYTSPTAIYAHAGGHGTHCFGVASHSHGFRTTAMGDYSHAGGSACDLCVPDNENRIVASGKTSFVHFQQNTPLTANTSWTTSMIGAFGDYSAILGGEDHNIEHNATSSGIFAGSGNTVGDSVIRSVILGGNYNVISKHVAVTSVSNNSILGGSRLSATTASHNCALIGGENNEIFGPAISPTVNNTVILGGNNIIGELSNTVYVPNLHVGDNTIIDGQAYTPEHITSSAHTSSTISLDFNNSNVQTITLSADTAMVLANPTNINNGAGYMVIVKQGISGGTLNFGTNYLWEGGVQPIITPTLNAVDVLSFVCFEYTGGTSALLGAYTQNFS